MGSFLAYLSSADDTLYHITNDLSPARIFLGGYVGLGTCVCVRAFGCMRVRACVCMCMCICMYM